MVARIAKAVSVTAGSPILELLNKQDITVELSRASERLTP